MKNRIFIVITLLVLLAALTGSAQATSPESIALVYVNLGSADDLDRFASTQLPLYATLEGGLLTGANQSGQQALQGAGLQFQVVDAELGSGNYYLAETFASRRAPDYSQFGQVLLNTASGVLVRMDPAQVNALSQAGAELRLITLTPKPIPSAQVEDIFPEVVDPDPLIQMMMDQVTPEAVSQYDRELAGELPVWVDGGWYTIPSRYTYSGTPIQKTTNYVGQHMADLGLDVEYHVWNNSTNPNVIGELPGLIDPDNVYIIGAHIDDVQGTPGADDNASGSVATLLAADILSQYQWGCTLRFAFWTGEEQGLNGSYAYAQRAYNNGENILGYLNLDMIAWNTVGSPNTIYLGYGSSVPQSHVWALLFDDVVDAYGIDLLPLIGTGYSGSSDHGSFLQFGFPAILGIEGDDDFNPYYHGSGDTPAHTDLTYFSTYIKASIATYAHMSNCLIPGDIGGIEGTVATSSVPLEGVEVAAQGSGNFSNTDITDAAGQYAMLALADTYTVTAQIYGYETVVVPDVPVTADVTTTLDIDMPALDVYTISGYVREAGSNVPLEGAIVEFTEDIPVDPVITDSDGFYTIDVAEGIWHLQASADQHAPQTETVDVTSDLQQDFNLSPFCNVFADDVENGNLGWTAQSPWSITNESWHSFNHSWTDSPGGYYQNNVDTSLTSPMIDLSAYTGMKLNFWHTYATETGWDYANVEISTNGGSTWTAVETYDGSNLTWTEQEIFLPQLDGQANAKIRFHFTADTSYTFDGWHIDDIALIGGGPACAPQGVYIDPPVQEGFGEPGTQVNYAYTVTNATPVDQDITLSVSGNVWETDAPASTGVLLAGTSTEVTVTVSIPLMPASVIIASDSFTLNAVGEVGEATATGTTHANVNPGVEVVSPSGKSGRPLEVVNYEFTITNTGDYTDSFTLEASGVWSTNLPGGANTGALTPGVSKIVTLLVTVPADAAGGFTDTSTLEAVSDRDAVISSQASVITAAVYSHHLPFIVK